MPDRRDEDISIQQRARPRTEGEQPRSGMLPELLSWMFVVALLIALMVFLLVNPQAIEAIWKGPMRLPGL